MGLDREAAHHYCHNHFQQAILAMTRRIRMDFLREHRLLHLLGVLLCLVMATWLLLGTGTVPFLLQAQSASDVASTEPEASEPGLFWTPQAKTRLIVELSSPSLAEAYSLRSSLDPDVTYFGTVAPDLQSYTLFLREERAAFSLNVPADLPVQVASPMPGVGEVADALAFDLVKNAVILESTQELTPVQLQTLESLPQVKYVHPDLPVHAQLYAGPTLIQVGTPWQNSPSGRSRAGQGILIASIDGGLHKDAPMFSGAGFEYPEWMPPNGLGIARANNGKIVVSRTYFRAWDPPLASDHLPWPGSGTSHGVHTGAIAGGNIVDWAVWDGLALDPLSGIAPGAWLGNYRVLYRSKQGSQTFFTAEGVLALEDAVVDGADIVVGAWGIGPSTASAPNDFLDSALVNTARAGVYVVMAAGNYGPLPFSVANPSDEYLSVGAVTTTGFLLDRYMDISDAAEPDSMLSRLRFASARFGPEFPQGTKTSYPLISGPALNAANAQGCRSWEPGSLDESMLLVSRGLCPFAEKVAHASQAGAAAVMVSNHAAGGDQLLEMVKGPAEFETPLPSLFVSHSSGLLLETLLARSPHHLLVHVSTVPEQVGNQPFVIPDFSGRGPTAYGGLKPDVVAPGVHILSQGYGPGDLDSERHTGYGQETGTSMAAPFVAGAVALIKEQHPHWTNDMITSALMSTAQYEGIHNRDGSVAQPTDMGAGLVDIERALNPAAFLVPAKISFGRIRSLQGIQPQVLEVINAGDESLALHLSVDKLVGSGRVPLDAFQVEPQTISLLPRASAKVTVTLQPELAASPTEYVQGYLVLRGGTQELHAPLFAWLDLPTATPEILLLDADLSPSDPDYGRQYTAVLDELGISYAYWDAAQQELKVPAYVGGRLAPKAILIFTGDGNRAVTGATKVPLPFTPHDLSRLAHYVAEGGSLLVMGRNAADFVTSAPLQAYLMSTSQSRLSPELTADSSTLTAQSGPEAPDLLQGLHLDLRAVPQSLGAVEPYPQTNLLPSETAVHDVRAHATFQPSTLIGALEYILELEAPAGTVVSDAWFYVVQDENQTRVKDLVPGIHLLPVFGTWRWQGQLELDAQLEAARTQGRLHVALQLQGTQASTLSGQVSSQPFLSLGSVAEGPFYSLTTAPGPAGQVPFLNLRADGYTGPSVIGLASDLSLDPAYTPEHGRTVFTTFGLEQINETDSYTSRADFLRQVLAFLTEPAAASD